MLTCRTFVLTGIVLGGLPSGAAGQSQLIQVPLVSKQVAVRQLVVPPLDFVEVCANVKARRALAWQFEAEEPLGFNTHLHLAGTKQYPQYGSPLSAAMSVAKGQLVPSSDQEHCWMWTNPKSVPVSIRVQLGP